MTFQKPEKVVLVFTETQKEFNTFVHSRIGIRVNGRRVEFDKGEEGGSRWLFIRVTIAEDAYGHDWKNVEIVKIGGWYHDMWKEDVVEDIEHRIALAK